VYAAEKLSALDVSSVATKTSAAFGPSMHPAA
jgi:hypothetical protein